jgi:aliphatic sulfonates family ABC transporter substrate-binding protein
LDEVNYVEKEFASWGRRKLVGCGHGKPSGFRASGEGIAHWLPKKCVLLIAKQQKLLEKRFLDQGITIKWVEFAYGPPLLEALNTGNIEYGATGDAPPVFAQAAHANLLYVASLPARGANQALLVQEDSSIKTLADLKGEKVGVAKASSAHSLLIAALDKANLTFADIKPVYLAPGDAAAAFTTGAIDVWAIWDPFYAIAEKQKGTRLLASALELAPQNSYFLANRSFTDKNPQIIAAINEELYNASEWARTHRNEAAVLFSEASGVELEAQKSTVERTEFVFSPITDEIATEQQAVADRYFKIGLIPKPINIRDIVWKWVPNI